MKKHFFLLMTLMMSFLSILRAQAQDITFIDPIFEAALLTIPGIDANTDGIIQVDEAAAYTGTLDVSNKGINDLSGIEYFTSILFLYCTQNNLTSLDVSALTNLRGLYCNTNKLKLLDLSQNRQLVDLYCYHNELEDLVVSNNPDLLQLNCGENQLKTIDVFQNPFLVNFYCGYNQLKIVDVTNNFNLSEFGCDGNQIQDISVLTNSLLRTLTCQGNLINSLVLSGNPSLQTLACGSNPLTSLVLSSNTDLAVLFCYYTELTSLDLSSNPNLSQLYCDDINTLSSLNIKNGNNNMLTSFTATNNPLLNCIQVDDPAYMNGSWGAGKDATANYNSNCGSCATYFASLAVKPGDPSTICAGGSTNLALNITGASPSNTYFDITYYDGISNYVTNRVFVTGSNVTAAFSGSPTVTTTYKLLSVTDANGCEGLIGPATSDTFELVTVIPIPTITTNPAVTTDLNDNTSVRLTSSPASSFAWYRNNVSNNKTTRSITVNTEGSYTVVTTNLATGCTNTSAPVIVSYLPCNAPSQITVSNITGTTGQVNFTTASNGITYELRYRQVKTGSSNTWTNTTGITTSPYTLTSLLPNSWYAVQMRTVCSTTKPTKFSAWVAATPPNFKTLPQALTAESLITNKIATENFNISITPNPARSIAVLHIGAKQASVSVIITNMYGKILWQSQHEMNNPINLPVQNFAAGMYIVSVSNGSETKIVKLVKE